MQPLSASTRQPPLMRPETAYDAAFERINPPAPGLMRPETAYDAAFERINSRQQGVAAETWTPRSLNP